MERQLRKKKIMTGIALLTLAAVYYMIFSFSADDAENSSAISIKVAEWLIRIYYRLFGSGGESVHEISAAAAAIENSVRKLAHFIEYMAVGFLAYGIVIMWMQNIFHGFLLVWIQLIVSAGIDEIHQYFVPGRHSSVKDVVIDTAGGMTGMLIILCMKGIVTLWNHILQPKSKTCS